MEDIKQQEDLKNDEASAIDVLPTHKKNKKQIVSICILGGVALVTVVGMILAATLLRH
jgi:hypothetical protein